MSCMFYGLGARRENSNTLALASTPRYVCASTNASTTGKLLCFGTGANTPWEFLYFGDASTTRRSCTFGAGEQKLKTDYLDAGEHTANTPFPLSVQPQRKFLYFVTGKHSTGAPALWCWRSLIVSCMPSVSWVHGAKTPALLARASTTRKLECINP